MLRPLRIAVSVVIGLCCVLVIVLWVRSYGQEDIISFGQSGSSMSHFVLLRGSLVICSAGNDPSNPGGWRKYAAWEPGLLGFSGFSTATSKSVKLPLWFLLALLALISLLPWTANRFSLRTALVATTLVSLTLGLITYATRG